MTSKMQRKPKLLSVFAAVVTALAMSLALLPKNAQAIEIGRVRHGTVAIVIAVYDAYLAYVNPSTYEIEGDTYLGSEIEYSFGSGFFIGEESEPAQYIVTNDHVVDDYVYCKENGKFESFYTDDRANSGYLLFVTGSSSQLRVYYDENTYDVADVLCYGDVDLVDLAVVKLSTPTTNRANLQIDYVSDAHVTQAVYAVGFPGNADNDFTSASKYGESDCSVYSGTISKIVKDANGVERIDITASIQHGNSGGPLVNDNGDVIGVNTNGWGDATEMNYYSISSNTLMAFLDQNNVKYAVASPSWAGGGSGSDSSTSSGESEGSSDKESSTASSGESKDDDKPAGSGGTEDSDSSSKKDKDKDDDDDKNSGSDFNPVPLVIILVSVAVLGVGAFIVIMVTKNKSQGAPYAAASPTKPAAPSTPPSPSAPTTPSAPSTPPTPTPQQAAQGQAQPTKKAIIRSLAAQHNGRMFPVGKAPVTLGRNPQGCVIVYAPDTNGVSGTHCSVSFDSTTNVFTLIDLGSTYGTFLASGQKLAPNVPTALRAGDIFYLGDKNNVCRVEVVQ